MIFKLLILNYTVENFYKKSQKYTPQYNNYFQYLSTMKTPNKIGSNQVKNKK